MKDSGFKENSAAEIYHCRGRLWLEGQEGTFLGYGRIVLLEQIVQSGSIAQAARSMKMSYKQAWDLVNSMNRQAGAPLVTKVCGGSRGGGAKVTERGLRAIAVFRAMDERHHDYLAEESRRFMAEFEKDDRS